MQNHQHGGDIYSKEYRIDFSANLNPLGMPESVREAAKAGVDRSVNYPDVHCRKLREALAKKEGVLKESIICGNGAAELIFLLAATEKPGRSLLVAPGFAEYEQALTSVNCRMDFYYLKEEHGFALAEDYLDRLKEEWDMIFLCNPNNPTGVTIEPGLLKQILGICKERKIRVVLDLCFLDFLEDSEKADVAAHAADYPNLFILKAFTKTYAMAGLRLGYGISADIALLKRMREHIQPWNVSIPAQMAGCAALKETEYVSLTRALITRERKWLKERLAELEFSVYDSKANFIFFKGPPGLTEKCAREGILIRDCGNYRGLEKQAYYRIAVRTHEENMELIKVLRKTDTSKDILEIERE